MKCFKCQHENQRGAKFCSKCGKNFQPNNNKENHNVRENDASKLRITYPNPEAMNTLKLIHEKKSSTIKKIWVAYVVFTLIGGGLVFLNGDSKHMQFFFYFSMFLAILSLITSTNMKTLSEMQYYSIPTSKDSQGQHHCIFCGNKGIYKSTIYKTNTTVNACSKCKEVFYNN